MAFRRFLFSPHPGRSGLGAVSLLLMLLGGTAGAVAADSLPAAPPTAVRVVMDDNYPPYTFRDSQGVPQGYLIDLWQLWQQKTGVRAKVTATDWAKAKDIMAAGQAEIIDTIFRTPEREQVLDFTPPYETIPVSIFTRKGITGITKVADLRGFQVGAKAGDACIDKLAEAGIGSVVAYDNYEKLVDAAVADQVKTFCLDELPANYLLYRANSSQAFNKAFVLYSGAFHRAVHKDDQATLALMQAGFAAISAEEYEALRNKWMGRQFLPFPWVTKLIYGLAAALILGLGLALWTVSLRRQVHRRTAELACEQAHLHTLINTIPDMIWLKDPQGIYLGCNPDFEKFFGATEAQIKGKRDHDFVDRELADFFLQKDQEAMAAGRSSVNEEWVTYQSDGRRVLLETIKTPMRDGHGKLIGVLGIARDITSLRRINRARRLLGDSNHAMMRSQTEEALLTSVCRVAVESGGYCLAWVGFAEQDEAQRVRLAAHAGNGSSYLEALHITWSDTEAGRGPTGSAIRRGTPVVNQDFRTHPGAAPWMAAAIAHGFQSSIALPLVIDQQVIGAFTIYAAEADAFQAEEVALLEKLAEDLAFGLQVLRMRLARNQAEAALKENEFLFRSQFALGNIGIAITSPAKHWLQVNPHLCHMLGYTEAELHGKTWEELTHPDDLSLSLTTFQRLLDGEVDDYELDKRFIRRDGEALHVHVTVSCYRAEGEVRFVISSVLDISERHRSEEKLALAAKVFENTVEGVIITDAQSRILTVNRAFTTITGYDEEEVRGQTPRLLKSEHHDAAFYRQLWDTLAAQGCWQGEVWNRRKSGETYPQWLSISAVRGAQGVSHYVAVFNDISDVKRSEERLNFLAYHDALTALPNRTLFRDRLEHSIARAQRNGSMVAVLYLDLDHFKHIN
ncbi:MAG TPA: PAS domain S-box protein, partial [Azospira sp.]|nr:PAS domain S-box protein [Azospira sp.]